MDEMSFNCHEIEIFMKLGVVFGFLGLIALLVRGEARNLFQWGQYQTMVEALPFHT